MKNDYTNNKFKELLDKLQQESWQLELLISGFAIFGLFSALEPIRNGYNEAIALESYSRFLFLFGKISCWVLIVNLVIHVVLRGLWIGAIGLRYVSGEIEYDTLNYKKRFTDYLKIKVGSFDKYIGTLENYCSVLFAVTFLFLFYIISFFMIWLIIFLAGNFFMESGYFSEITGALFLALFAFIFLFLALIVFIDFLTQGYLKKKEWTSFLYFPIYKMFSIITLSFLYRPLVYNFLDNKFGKKITLILIPIYAFAFYITTLNNVRSNYISENSFASIHFSKKNNYLSLLKSNEYVKTAAIQSKIIEKPYLKVFIPFKEKIEDFLFEHNNTLKPQEDNRGLKSDFQLFSSTKSRLKRKNHFIAKDSIYGLYLKTLNNNYIFKIDSLSLLSDFVITTVNNQLGFESILPIKSVNEGKHILKIDRFFIDKKSKAKKIEKVTHIPFWYFKD